MTRLQSLRPPAMGMLLASAAVVSASLMAAVPVTAAQGSTGPHANTVDWAGYVASGQTYTSITASLTVPAVGCFGELPFTYAISIGLDGYLTNSREWTGIMVTCGHGKRRESVRGFYTVSPDKIGFFPKAASAGDNLTATVKYTGGRTYELILTDTTKGWTQEQTKQPPVASNASAEAFTTPNGPVGEAKFSRVRVDGKLFNSFSPTRLTFGSFAPGPLRGGTFAVKPA